MAVVQHLGSQVVHAMVKKQFCDWSGDLGINEEFVSSLISNYFDAVYDFCHSTQELKSSK